MGYPPPIPPRPSGWAPTPPNLPPRTQASSNENHVNQDPQAQYYQSGLGQGSGPQPYGDQYNVHQNQAQYSQHFPHQQSQYPQYYTGPQQGQAHQPPVQQHYQQPPPQQHYQQPSFPYQSQNNQPPTHHAPPSQGQIWQPSAGTTWQYVLGHRIKLDHTIEQTSVWIIDLFDTTADDVAELHRRGRKVIAYFSAGSYENWRPDASRFPTSDMGKKLDDWEGEKWIRTSSPTIREIMTARMDLAVQKGFDGIDPDNVDGYDNKNGLGLTKNDAVDYVLWLAREAHGRGLAVGLKNANDIIPRVIREMQWCVQEQCVQYGDEEEYLPFIRQGKPVFHVEYPKGEDTDSKRCNNEKEVTGKQLQKCVRAREMGFSTIIKNINLDQWIQRC
ncbi:glycoside hydrolase superfamily [Elsinoe ampelina]|uniref:alpha-galactosidase n=1 Tax=Elsinoe ampelina TaxID=302913 RepID=A0A6A6GE41_9PEZI|nr:glycoside hydrolase superfamily [Elsinoe ampelina]